MSVRLFIGNLPYTATEAELREHLSSVGVPTSVVLPVDRETGRPRGFAFVDYADRAVAEEAIKRFDQQPFKGRGLAVSEARPREDRPPRRRRARAASAARVRAAHGGYASDRRPRRLRRAAAPGGFGGPRPGGTDGGAGRAARKNFGPDAPPKHKRKPHENRREQGPKPIKERPVSRLYENDEDWRAQRRGRRLDIDNIATHKDADEVDTGRGRDGGRTRTSTNRV